MVYDRAGRTLGELFGTGKACRILLKWVGGMQRRIATRVSEASTGASLRIRRQFAAIVHLEIRSIAAEYDRDAMSPWPVVKVLAGWNLFRVYIYVLNGTEQWITNGTEAEAYSGIALTNPVKGPRGA